MPANNRPGWPKHRDKARKQRAEKYRVVRLKKIGHIPPAKQIAKGDLR